MVAHRLDENTALAAYGNTSPRGKSLGGRWQPDKRSENRDLIAAERYDPSDGNWTAAGSLKVARAWHTATLLKDGANFAILTATNLLTPTGPWAVVGRASEQPAANFSLALPLDLPMDGMRFFMAVSTNPE